ncbi:DUF4468 domain-containing protein [uncultured Mucilaginibacter sp.]|uniref:DUF4468 domain-containing protein n=1 Tax=uncultured Mucilaginibacter sp. TaxID=797541 RepID=UPI0025DE7C29|nr:DUF4468 domain-containing protein [uncultured Mucilaginibacter sp.]
MNKLLFILLFLPFSAFSQKDLTKYDKDTVVYAPLPVDSTGAIVFRRVYGAPNTPKTELYARAKIWTAIAFRSAKNVIQLDDDQKNSLIIKGVQEGGYNLWFTIQFTIKDNKFRVLISQFWIERLEVTSYPLVIGGPTTRGFVKYYPDKEYNELYEYNINVKNGSGDINGENGITKHHVKQIASRIQVVSDFANATFQEIQKAMQQSAKGDDF